MLPSISLLIGIILILILFIMDKRGKTASVALWIPLLWVLILGSRMVGHWFGAGTYASEGLMEGSSIDRSISLILMISGLLVLFARRIKFPQLVQANRYLFVFFLYCGISILWSDYPFVAFKRWIKDIGNIIMVLVILSDPTPYEAVKTIFRRTAFVLIPLSVILYKYFPHLGRVYGRWSGELSITGVATSKNSLGVLCAACALFFFWDLLTLRSNKDNQISNRELIVIVSILVVTVWLLMESNSKTSLLCMVIGLCILVAMKMQSVRRNLRYLIFYIFCGIMLLLLVNYAIDLESLLLSSLGRDDTLTGRTELWSVLLPMVNNPLIGTGYDSFWLGDRLEKLWAEWWWHPTTAHNGYLEIYLNLGLVGLISLIGVILFAYKNIINNMIRDADYGPIRFAFLVITIIYNYSETSFSGNYLMWFIFLLITVECQPRACSALA